MKIAIALMSLAVGAPLALSASAAYAQGVVQEEYSVSHRRNYDGSYTTKDSDGYSVTTRRTPYNGGITTKDNEGNSVSCRTIHYRNEVKCRHITTHPAYGDEQEAPEPDGKPDAEEIAASNP